ncbi:hypothetical protein RCL_jg11341.t1 [Rhizophagus clarus]|uniref:Uncharacterized protein n=1 Tax=Rhizophagus clarus TaxID=94130 RepID=A0A8H3LJV5_9GLOM|nr:hypothetical protein RCL_jg11341.t1 [Rhizophagus clarus]
MVLRQIGNDILESRKIGQYFSSALWPLSGEELCFIFIGESPLYPPRAFASTNFFSMQNFVNKFTNGLYLNNRL